jgi:hypothetical protein
MDDTQWENSFPHFRLSPAIVPRSYLTSESILPNPADILKVRHSRLAFPRFPLPIKGFSSLSGHLGKERKVPCLPQFRFGPNPIISFCASIYSKSSSPFLRLFPHPFLGKYSNHESMLLRDSLVGWERGTMAGEPRK